MNGFGIYFGDASIDTITKNNIPLTYLSPQVQNPPFSENIITDTLNWVEIKGSFMANGTEKYALIGNFLSDNATQTSPIMGPYYPQIWTDVLIDDVSCLEIDMPVFAGADTFFIPGTSVYLGRPRDVGIDEACTWYQLPNMTTAKDTAAGIWVTPVGTSTYVVRQEICGNVKWDTVVVRESPLGLEDLRLENKGLKVWPVPAKDDIQLQLEGYNGSALLMVFNSLGVKLRDEELLFKDNKVLVRVSDLAAGSYIIELRAKESSYRSKLVVER
jgi:hypothetical protein